MSLQKIFVLMLLIMITLVLLPNSVLGEYEPRYGGTFIWSFPEPAHLNRDITTGIREQLCAKDIFNSLIYFDWDNNPIPELAEDWEISEDGLKYTFYLNRDVVFHDGVPMTSADVKYTYEEVTKVGPFVFDYDALESIETPDDYTVVFNLKFVYPPFILLMGPFNGGMILPKHLYEGTDILQNPYNLEPIGTGPFKFENWVSGSHITLVKNENYWRKDEGGGKLPYLDKIVISFIAEGGLRILALEKGEIDYAPLEVPVADVSRLQNDPNITVAFKGAEAFGTIDFLGFNLRKEPWNKLKVRQAFAWAIDRKQIAEVAVQGYVNTVPVPLHSQFQQFWPDDPPTYTTDDREKSLENANKLLDEAGYPKGSDGVRFEASLEFPAGFAEIPDVVEVIRDNLLDVGVIMELRPTDKAAFDEKIFLNWDFETFVLAKGTGFDPALAPKRVFHSKYVIKSPYVNAMGYENDRVDELFDLGDKELDSAKRIEIYKELFMILATELPVVPLIERPKISAYRNEIVPHPDWGQLPYGSWEGLGVFDTLYRKEAPTPAPTTLVTYLIAAIIVLSIIALIVSIYLVKKKRRKS